MSDVPLTEKRFIELLEQLLEEKLEEKLDKKIDEKLDKKLDEKLDKKLDEKLDKKFEDFEKKLDRKFEEKLDRKFEEKLTPIYNTLKKLEGFQKNEADGIVFELQMILKKYIDEKYPRMTSSIFPMKSFNDPYTDKLITDLDAAFLLKAYKHKANLSRLKQFGIKLDKLHIDSTQGSIFILAEAKHFINKSKISEKLGQFNKIRHAFILAKKISNGEEITGVSSKFIQTIQRNKYISEIDECYLFFGAAYWDKGLLLRFMDDINRFERLLFNYNNSDGDIKIQIYNKLIELESKWYTRDSVESTSPYDSPLKYVKIIQPSGERYGVFTPKEPNGISFYHGGQTRKVQRSN
jgi:hypothetical protein